MTGFPELPLTRGETDDEASVHLYSRVGPAFPIIRSNFDQQIKHLLQDPHYSTAVHYERLNGQFGHFMSGKTDLFGLDYDKSRVDGEIFTHSNDASKQTCEGLEKKKIWSSSPLHMTFRLFGFICGVLFLFVGTHFCGDFVNSLYPSSVSTIHTRLQRVEDWCQSLRDDARALDVQVDKIVLTQEDSARSIQATSDIAVLKRNIFDELISVLHEYVPVYIKDNEIHFIPEFYNQLQSSLNIHSTNLTESCHSFCETCKNFLREEVRDLVKMYPDNLSGKCASERVNTGKNFSEQSKSKVGERSVPKPRFKSSTIKDNYTRESTSYAKLGNSTGAFNYASYGCGSRIIWYLTTTPRKHVQQNYVASKFSLSWLDFLNKGPRRTKHNANNILFNSGNYWDCGSSSCSVGIRLSSPIILEEVLLWNPLENKPPELRMPTTVSIYVKPEGRTRAYEIPEYLNETMVDNQGSKQYYNKFFKLKKWQLREQSNERVSLSLNEVNTTFYTREIFVKLECDEGSTGLFNIEVLGTPYGSADITRYVTQTDEISRKAETSHARSHASLENNAYALDDDECI